MKKFIVVLVAVIGFGFAANAQQCTIQGTNNSTIVVESCDLSGSTVNVVVGNDDYQAHANVSFTVEVTYTFNSTTKTKTYSSGTFRAQAGSSTPKSVSVDASMTVGTATYKATSASVKSISGSKCN